MLNRISTVTRHLLVHALRSFGKLGLLILLKLSVIIFILLLQPDET